MVYKVVITSHFGKQLKPLTRKFRHLKRDIEETLPAFDKNLSIALGNYTYKLRLKSSDLQRGKSRSFRLIVFVVEYENILAPIAIYFKGEKEDLSKAEIAYHLTKVISELETDLQ